MFFVDLKKELELFQLEVKFEIGNEILGIQGPSGSGKTTILNLISGLIKGDSTEITIDDLILESTDKCIYLPTRERNIGYMFQNYALFPHYNVMDNIKFGMKDKDLYLELIKMLQLEKLLKRYPSEISGGEKQRVALARTLVTTPKVLLMDEPFSALDLDLRRDLYKNFRQLIKTLNIPVILITHDNEEASILADKIIHINKGKITA
ncbi:ATP-binding cassette domain-containing protein [Lagierella sp.]|uniref:sulfate/molybdate ABC transporter ATP-binding protein n=1 Tax=Lagierella sp. TaxID=2849657 RepID=UPI00262ACB07|nr:ATP-binding cassette domain-containing protein [Lagierella sp.]